MPLFNEVVRVGSANGRVKNIYANGLIVIFDIRGEVNEGGVSFACDDSGEIITFSNFKIDDKYDHGFDERDFYLTDNKIVVLDNGAFVAQDAHFTGQPSQNYQTKNMLVIE